MRGWARAGAVSVVLLLALTAGSFAGVLGAAPGHAVSSPAETRTDGGGPSTPYAPPEDAGAVPLVASLGSITPAIPPPPTGQIASSLSLLTNQLSAAQLATPGCVLPEDIAFDPANQELYLACSASDVVMPISGSGQPIPSGGDASHGGPHSVGVSLGGSPSEIVYDPALGWLYVLVHPGHGAGGGFTGVVAINGETNQVVGEVSLPGASSLTVDGANSRVYVAGDTGAIYEVAGTTLLASVLLSSAVGQPQVVWDGSNDRVYVAGPNTVWALTPGVYPGDWTAESYATAVSEPAGMAYDSGNGLVYIVGAGGTSVVRAPSTPWVTNLSVGGLNSAIAYASGDGNLYETLPSLDQVAVLDPSNATVLGTKSVGSHATAIAYDSSNKNLFVSLGSDAVDILPLGTGGGATSVAVGVVPDGVAYDPQTGLTFVSTTAEQHGIFYYFVHTNGSHQLVEGGTINVDPAISTGSELTLTGSISGGSGGITVTGTGMLILGVTTPGNSTGVVVLPANDSDDTVVGAGNLILTGGNGSASVAYDPSTGGIVVANAYSGSVTFLNPNGSSFTLGGTLQLGSDPDAVAMANGSYLYVANAGSDNVSVVQASASAGTRVVGSVAVGGSPDGLAFDSVNGYLYVANQLSNNVSVIDTATNHVVGTLAVGSSPSAIVYDNATARLYVANAGSNNVSVIDGSRAGGLNVLGSMSVGADPTSIALDNATGELLVTDGASGAVSILPTAALYSLTFTETGLPAGLGWTGSVDSVQGLTNGTTLTWNVTNGTFSWDAFQCTTENPNFLSVTNSANNTATVAKGTIVLGGPQDFLVTFQKVAMSGALFSESGLPGGEVWSMTVNGTTETNTTLSTATPTSTLCASTLSGMVDCGLLDFHVPNGILHFTIHAPPGFGVALIKGSGVLNSSAVTVNGTGRGWLIEFGALRSIAFVESALPQDELYAGATWSVSLLPAVQHGGPPALINGSDPTAVEFTAPVGASYRFAITPPGPEYKVVPSSGILRVPSAQAFPGTYTKTVRFVLLTSHVAFRETGIPGRSAWSVTITDGTSPAVPYPLSERNPGPGSIAFRLPAGTYLWAATVPGSALPPVTGTIQVSYPSASTPVQVAFGSSASAAGCFAFTSNGILLGTPVCNANANDVLANFTQVPGAVCANQFTLGGANVGSPLVCPVGANQLEVNWSGSSSGSVITSCYWAASGVPVGTCPVPAPPQPDGLVLFLAQITSVSWTVNGSVVGPPVPAPPAANGLVFIA
jgi:YVTN family beta-propeller protein